MSRQWALVVQALETGMSEVMIMLAANVAAGLKEDNPFDTGFSANCWIPSVGVPSEETGAAAQAVGFAKLLRYVVRMGAVFVTNNAAYIQRLADGWSPQASSGWVQRRVALEVKRTQKQVTQRRGLPVVP